jgi:hypothetical protein
MSSPADITSTSSTTTSSSTTTTTSPSSSTASATSVVSNEEHCHTTGCNNVAKQSCPTCIELKVSPVSRYCSQDCFKSSWKEHNISVHKRKERMKESQFSCLAKLFPKSLVFLCILTSFRSACCAFRLLICDVSVC